MTPSSVTSRHSSDHITRFSILQSSARLARALLAFLTLLARNLLLAVPVLLAVIYASYLGLEMATGAGFAPAAEYALREGNAYFVRLLHGDLGMGTAATSINNPAPVASYLWEIFSRSLGLLAVSLALATLLGVAIGLRAATRTHDNRALPLLMVSIIGVSMPSFFAALLLQLLIIRITRITGTPLLPVGGFGWDSHLILPALVLAARPIAQITRVTYLSVREALRADYVRTARSKGISQRRIIAGHVMRNVAVPIFTTLGLSLRFALSSLPVVELFFGWPGAGFVLLKAIAAGDTNTTIALLLCFAALFILVNLLLDLTYSRLDPRLRALSQDAAKANRSSALEALQGLLAAGRRLVAYLISDDWWRDLERSVQRMGRRLLWHRPRGAEPRSGAAELTGAPDESGAARRQRGAWQAAWRGNVALWLGGLISLGLLVVFIFGPQLAPHSPFTTRGLEIVDGEFLIPPFAPDAVYPWGTDVMGRDMMSLVLAGAQQTLTLAAIVVLARLIIGVLLGALAGWFYGSWLDRLIVWTAEVLAAFPTLLLAMLVILSLGIRSGTRPFLVGLSIVGWAELMQYVRSAVINLRPRPFIESAVAIGAREPRIVWHHVMPNLLPALISLAALEMGAVLMLLGELGFIGIFIGGGAFAELQIDGPPYHYSDVPEWASLLANVRLYARSYPWTALYPAGAFFLSILGFNLLGEGIRRVVEEAGVQFTRVFNRGALTALVILLIAGSVVRGNLGAAALYREQARRFDAEDAMTLVDELAQPAWSGRALGSEGLSASARFIADEFDALGLQRAGEDGTFFIPRQREFTQLTGEPSLTLNDGRPGPVYGQDFAAFPYLYQATGQAKGTVQVLAAGYLGESNRGFSLLPRAIRNLDYSDQILMVLSEEDALRFSRLPYAGMLVVTDDPASLTRRYTLSAREPVVTSFGGITSGQTVPTIWISPSTANRILAESGRTISELRSAADALVPDELLTVATSVNATLNVPGEVRKGVETAHVIGQLPAVQGQNLGGNVIVVMAQYDTPPLGPEGVYPAANDNGSGIALMLEIIRTLKETDYRPYKTFLFIAYSGEGTENGVPAYPPDVEKLTTARAGFAGNLSVEAVVDLRGVAAGEGNQLVIEAGGSLRLADLFEESASRLNAPVTRSGEPVDISIVFDRSQTNSGGQDAPQVGIRWEGWEARARTASDTVQTLDESKLESAGQVVTLALMTLGREDNY
ncbi:MAG: ABC transporter permease subunit [Caldilineaceae bacterium]|nr:ABC transporter permease subunit [Caldilineaceae bacterium]